jgi:hypothetical protein
VPSMYIFLAGMWLIRKKRAKHVYFPKHHILYQVDKNAFITRCPSGHELVT